MYVTCRCLCGLPACSYSQESIALWIYLAAICYTFILVLNHLIALVLHSFVCCRHRDFTSTRKARDLLLLFRDLIATVNTRLT